VTHIATFALGVLAGLLVGLWLIARSIATPETASVPRDLYLDRLVKLAEEHAAKLHADLGLGPDVRVEWDSRPLRPGAHRSYDSGVQRVISTHE